MSASPTGSKSAPSRPFRAPRLPSSSPRATSPSSTRFTPLPIEVVLVFPPVFSPSQAHMHLPPVASFLLSSGTSWLGPLVFAVVNQMTGSFRLAFLCISLFFALGAPFLMAVNVPRVRVFGFGLHIIRASDFSALLPCRVEMPPKSSFSRKQLVVVIQSPRCWPWLIAPSFLPPFFSRPGSLAC